MSVKVSVIVAVYCPGDHLDDVLDSCAAQTLPHSDFELLLIDDGSPDGTWERLVDLERTRANVWALRVPHSGWPSAPRNAGLDAAVGEYCLFMDHDDRLFPDALRAAHEFAVDRQADVLNAKEVRTDVPSWGWAPFARDTDDTRTRLEPHPLAPLNPHKLYRTEWLREHDIRFVEGRRVLYEDRLFNIACLRSAAKIATMASAPFYHWVRRATPTASSSFGEDPEEFWNSIENVFRCAYTELASQPAQLEATVLHHYQVSVIATFSHGFPDQDAVFKATALRRCRAIVAELVDPAIDRLLSSDEAARAQLLRSGEFTLLEQLCGLTPGLSGTATATTVDWVDGRLELTGQVRWADVDGRPLPLDEVEGDGDGGGDVVRLLPPELTASLSPSLLRVGDELEQAVVRVGLTDRHTRLTWWVPTTTELRLNRIDGQILVSHQIRAVIDPARCGGGSALDSGVWEVSVLTSALGRTYQRRLRSTRPVASAVTGGRAAIAYATKGGMLALDLGERVRSLAGSGSFATAETVLELTGEKCRFAIPLDRIITTGPVDLDAPVALDADEPSPGRLTTAEDGRLTLHGEVPLRPGTFRLHTWAGSRRIDTGVRVHVGTDRQVIFSGR